MYMNEKKVPCEFKAPMETIQFKNLVSTMTQDKTEENTLPVNIALVIRTSTNNRILVQKCDNKEQSTTIIIPVTNTKSELGYFSLLEALRDSIDEIFNPDLEVMLRTILVPNTIFKKDGEAYINITLVLRDSDEEHFTKNNKYDFEYITEIPLNNLDWCSTIILPKEPIVR